MEILNSTRTVRRASYVTAKFTDADRREHESKPGGAVVKISAVSAVASRVSDQRFKEFLAREAYPQDSDEAKLAKLVTAFLAKEQPRFTLIGPEIAHVPWQTVSKFVKDVAECQEESIDLSGVLAQSRTISPVGWLHLEKIEMYPVGVERGDLVFTVPMAPGETVSISHKEWSVTGKEFEQIVQDYFESYSEKGVVDKTDASLSAENQSQKTNAMSFGASVSGEYTGVTITSTLGLQNSATESRSAKQAIQTSRELTEKASARSRQEHKVSVRVESKAGTEDATAKTITNDTGDVRRIDYYRMMRKWKSKLYRYGLRQTYDIAIPIPGARLWSHHQRLREIADELATPMSFTLDPGSIDGAIRLNLEKRYGVLLEKQPAETLDISLTWITPEHYDYDNTRTRVAEIHFDVPPGYFVDTQPLSDAQCVKFKFARWSKQTQLFTFTDYEITKSNAVKGDGYFEGYSNLYQMRGATGHQIINFFYGGISSGTVTLHLPCRLGDRARSDWQRRVWEQAKAAAQAQHDQRMARLQSEHEMLHRKLIFKDTLRLRRLEREELVRVVLAWLLGPAVNIDSTPTVADVLARIIKNEQGANGYGGPDFVPSAISEDEWAQSLEQGELVKLVHQAVEWENMLYFLYPYFWGSLGGEPARMLFDFPDAEHERFLRAGYVRVVLPIRPGFERDFTSLLEEGGLPESPEHPYVTIAQDIENFAKTNYAGIPPANPELNARPLLYPEQRRTWEIIQSTASALETYRQKHGDYPTSLTQLPDGQPVDAWGHGINYRMPGLGADFDLWSNGADNIPDAEQGRDGLDADISTTAAASLIATWYDYTPTSGLDIEVDTPIADIG